MYLISIYFDEETDRKIKGYMKQIAKYTGNTAMMDGNVPPHITVGAFRTDSEEIAKEIFRRIVQKSFSGNIQWVTVGSFLPSVIYISPILNEYLYQLSEITKTELNSKEGIWVDKRYQPHSWFPHTTLGKKLTREELLNAFKVLQGQFGPFMGEAVKIGLAVTNPYRDLEICELK